MKQRGSRLVGEQTALNRTKSDMLAGGQLAQRNQIQIANQQSAAQSMRKRRSSINVYDQPSSLNSRLRQLETDMLRLDEDRSKLFDDTHSQLAQYELKLNEIHAILKSRQDNVEKYVEDMKVLVQAKEEFERQTKALNERYERMQEKFMHRETTVSREIKLLKNKFELLEKNRQFRSILQKSSTTNLGASESNEEPTGGVGPIVADGSLAAPNNEDAISGTSALTDKISAGSRSKSSRKRVLFKMPRIRALEKFCMPFYALTQRKFFKKRTSRVSNVSIVEPSLRAVAADSGASIVKEDCETSQKYLDDFEVQQTEGGSATGAGTGIGPLNPAAVSSSTTATSSTTTGTTTALVNSSATSSCLARQDLDGAIERDPASLKALPATTVAA